MPAKSEKQRKLFGVAHGIQKGTTKPSKASGRAKRIARTVSAKDVRDFARKKKPKG